MVAKGRNFILHLSRTAITESYETVSYRLTIYMQTYVKHSKIFEIMDSLSISLTVIVYKNCRDLWLNNDIKIQF